jgi:hypothetical protein
MLKSYQGLHVLVLAVLGVFFNSGVREVRNEVDAASYEIRTSETYLSLHRSLACKSRLMEG